MSVTEIISVVCSLTIVLITFITSFVSLAKKGKKSKVLTILSTLPSYISQAEEIFGKGNGTAKLQWVLTQIQIQAVKANLDISDDVVKSEVESILLTPQKKELNKETTRSDIQ